MSTKARVSMPTVYHKTRAGATARGVPYPACMSTPTPGPAAGGPAWTEQDLAASPHLRADKQDRVRGMFAAISRSYDLNNRLHSFGQDQAWRRFAVRQAQVKETDEVLDVACGTGDLTRLFAQGVAPSAPARRVIGLDYTGEMLDVARTKRDHPTDAGITYVQGDAMALPYADASFDIVSIAFGIRNVQRPDAAMAEFARVLRPGGRLIILEFDRPSSALVRWGNDLYTRHIMPRTATFISGDKSGAYKYLPKSVETFLTRHQLRDLALAKGFASARFTPLTFGVCICHVAVR
jgi:demethylmenaquinone methyltransferase/2-methoxy-6-polyprenyl-1,4-benzoquinol methylase